MELQFPLSRKLNFKFHLPIKKFGFICKYLQIVQPSHAVVLLPNGSVFEKPFTKMAIVNLSLDTSVDSDISDSDSVFVQI